MIQEIKLVLRILVPLSVLQKKTQFHFPQLIHSPRGLLRSNFPFPCLYFLFVSTSTWISSLVFDLNHFFLFETSKFLEFWQRRSSDMATYKDLRLFIVIGILSFSGVLTVSTSQAKGRFPSIVARAWGHWIYNIWILSWNPLKSNFLIPSWKFYQEEMLALFLIC